MRASLRQASIPSSSLPKANWSQGAIGSYVKTGETTTRARKGSCPSLARIGDGTRHAPQMVGRGIGELYKASKQEGGATTPQGVGSYSSRDTAVPERSGWYLRCLGQSSSRDCGIRLVTGLLTCALPSVAFPDSRRPVASFTSVCTPPKRRGTGHLQ